MAHHKIKHICLEAKNATLADEKVQMCRRNKLANKCEMCCGASQDGYRVNIVWVVCVPKMGYSALCKFACLGGAFLNLRV